MLAKDESGFGEKDEALCIVEVIPLGCAVEIFLSKNSSGRRNKWGYPG